MLKLWGVQTELLVPNSAEAADAENLEAVLPSERALVYVKRVTQTNQCRSRQAYAGSA